MNDRTVAVLRSINKDVDTASVLKQIIDRYDDCEFGIRTLSNDEHYKIGDIARQSYDWDYDNDCSTYFTTKKKLNGTCATAILGNDISDIAVALCKSSLYDGNTKVLLRSKSVQIGYDPSELIMKNAIVEYIWTLSQ